MKLYGKTGSGVVTGQNITWYVGWLENGSSQLVFAYIMDDSAYVLTRNGEVAKDLAMQRVVKFIEWPPT